MKDKKTPVLSVVVPAYNAEKTLCACIDSLLNQESDEIEIIISNDGSTDDTQSIIESYVQKHQCVSYVIGENGGLSCARNRGIRKAAGRWITFVDSDDYIAPGIYSKIIEVLTTDQPDMLEYQFWIAINGTNYEAMQNQLPKDTLLDCKWLEEVIVPVALNISDKRAYFIENYVWNKVYNAEIIRKNNVLFDESRRKWEDRLFSLTFLQYAKTYYSMSQYGYCYVCGSGQTLSGKFEPDILRIIMDSYRKYLAMYGDKYCFDNPYTTNYFCNLLIDIAKDQFAYACSTALLKEMFSIFVTDDVVGELFGNCDIQDDGKRKIVCAIRAGNIENIYDALERYVVLQKSKERTKQRIMQIRNLLSKVKRVIKGEK